MILQALASEPQERISAQLKILSIDRGAHFIRIFLFILTIHEGANPFMR